MVSLHACSPSIFEAKVRGSEVDLGQRDWEERKEGKLVWDVIYKRRVKRIVISSRVATLQNKCQGRQGYIAKP